jgi:hypothetical protein
MHKSCTHHAQHTAHTRLPEPFGESIHMRMTTSKHNIRLQLTTSINLRVVERFDNPMRNTITLLATNQLCVEQRFTASQTFVTNKNTTIRKRIVLDCCFFAFLLKSTENTHTIVKV